MTVDRNNPVERLLSYSSGAHTLGEASVDFDPVNVSDMVAKWRATKPVFNIKRLNQRLKMLYMVKRLKHVYRKMSKVRGEDKIVMVWDKMYRL